MDSEKTIESIVKNKLCVGCGACALLCPKKAIKITLDNKAGVYLPEINKNKCINCGKCLEVCPRYNFSSRKLNLEIFGEIPRNVLLGNYLNCYAGYAIDPDIRQRASSGGLITALLIFALKKRIINGALVVRMKKDKPLEAESFVARTVKEIISAEGSKYCPVSISQGLKEIISSEKKEKFAIVGRPCDIEAIRKMEEINSDLKKKIILHFGLFCNRTPNFNAIKIFLKKLKIQESDVTKIVYRDEGWPGNMIISVKEKDVRIPLPRYWNFLGSDFFTPVSCFMCSDHTAELSDISFGDAWLPEFGGDRIGTSIIISRSLQGEEILQKAVLEGIIKIKLISSHKVILSQLIQLYLKKKNIEARTKLFGGKISFDNVLRSDLLDYFLAFFPWINAKLSRSKGFIKVLEIVPLRFLFLYDKFVKQLYYGKARFSFKNYIIEANYQKNKRDESKVKKIVITNYGNRFNKGTAAILHSQVEALKKIIPVAEFYVFTYYPEIKIDLEENLKVLEVISNLSKKRFFTNLRTFSRLSKCGLWYLFHKYFYLDIKILRSGGGLDEYYNADIVIDTGGDGLTEDYGTPINIVLNLLPGVLLKKPVVIYAESIGLFNKWYNRELVRFLLNRVKLITLREEISEANVKKLGLKKIPVFMTADPAFSLGVPSDDKIREILAKEKIKDKERIVGISVSKLFSRYEFNTFTSRDNYEKYIGAMTKIIDYLIDTFRVKVVFIPHVIDWPRNDDRMVADEIGKMVKNKGNVISIKGDYTPEETKGIIGQCDLFIGARMHACIASASMYVPTITIAYSHKAYGIIGEMLGCRDLIIDIKDISFNTLRLAVDKVWRDREKIKEELKNRMESIKRRALLNAELVKKIINENESV